TIVNSRTIVGGFGVKLDAGGTITNGSATDGVADIEGQLFGVQLGGTIPSLVTNFGRIAVLEQSHYGAYAVGLMVGGTVVNGSATDTTATLLGFMRGVDFGSHGSGAVTNFGTIAATQTATSIGVAIAASAELTNGSPSDVTALIAGYNGAELGGVG